MKTDLSNPKSIETPFLRIRGNCLEIQNTTIQLSNISLFSTADVAVQRFPFLSVLLVLAGLVFLKFSVPVGLLLLAIGVAWIIVWYSDTQKTKQLKRLTIITNSGNVFPIIFNDEAFLKRVVSIITEIIRDPKHARDITINVKECTFMDDASVVQHLHHH